jgi:hypothetical protein
MNHRPRFLPRELIEVRSYDGKPRDDLAEVYKVTWSPQGCWLYHVRCFTAEGEKARFRNFLESKLEVA